jgi:hypothetical protein
MISMSLSNEADSDFWLPLQAGEPLLQRPPSRGFLVEGTSQVSYRTSKDENASEGLFEVT